MNRFRVLAGDRCARAWIGRRLRRQSQRSTLPPRGAPHFPDYVFPAVPGAAGGRRSVDALHELGWQWLQAGDPKAAERNFTAALRQAPGFYPSEAGLGYAALARKDNKEAATHFERALTANPAYAPGAGRARRSPAHAWPARTGVVEFRGSRRGRPAAAIDCAAASRSSASAVSRTTWMRRGRRPKPGASQRRASMYERTIAASPDSPFLYRELAIVERREGNLAGALEHAQKAATLNPTEPRNFTTIGGDLRSAVGVRQGGRRLRDRGRARAERRDRMRRSKTCERRPPSRRCPRNTSRSRRSPTVTRAQLAALIGVRLDDLLKRAPRSNSVVITDTRGSWAAPWIMSVARAGLMEVYPNHTFQPNAIVRRGDLAQAASKALSLIAAGNPRLAATLRTAHGRFPGCAAGSSQLPGGVRWWSNPVS